MTFGLFPFTGDDFLTSDLFSSLLHQTNLLPVVQKLFVVGVQHALLAKLFILELSLEELVLSW